MSRLGYERYAVQGTDVGAGVAGMLAMVDSERVVGTHLTGTAAAMPFGPSVDLDSLSEADKARGECFNEFQVDGLGYLHIQATRPQTLAYSLNDSPVGQLERRAARRRRGEPLGPLPFRLDRMEPLTDRRGPRCGGHVHLRASCRLSAQRRIPPASRWPRLPRR